MSVSWWTDKIKPAKDRLIELLEELVTSGDLEAVYEGPVFPGEVSDPPMPFVSLYFPKWTSERATGAGMDKHWVIWPVEIVVEKQKYEGALEAVGVLVGKVYDKLEATQTLKNAGGTDLAYQGHVVEGDPDRALHGQGIMWSIILNYRCLMVF